MNTKIPYRNSCGTQRRVVFALSLALSFFFSTQSFSQAPVNDLCEDALVVNCGDTISGETTMSTSTGDPSDGCGTSDGAPGNWYRFTGTGDIVDLSLCGSSYDTKIRVYSGDCNTLVCVGGNDDSCSLQSEFAFISDIGTEYLIYVFGFNTAVGNYDLNLTCTPPPPPPPNDDCVAAESLTVNPDEVCTSVTAGTIAGATVSTEPNTCNPNSIDVWYSFTASNDIHTVTLQNVVGNTTSLNFEVLDGTCGAFTNVYCGNPPNDFVEGLTIGTTYYIRVFNNNGDVLANTTFDICIGTFIPPPPPDNDECSNATVAQVNAGDTCTLLNPGTIEGATASTEPYGCPSGTPDDDVWYQFVATSNYHGIELLNVSGSTTDLYHALYEGSDCNSLTEISCSDPNDSSASGLTIGETYYIRVFSWTSTPFQDTTFDLCIITYPTPNTCLEADPFCSLEGLIFENDSSGTPSPPGIDYECLFTQPNPTWFFLQIDAGGDLDFEIVQNTEFDANGNPIGTPLDVDFIAWGPFNSVSDGCAMLGPETSIACSYSPAPVENFSINGATSGEFYVLLITNFNGSPGFISLQQTNIGDPDAGTTDCTILDECEIVIDGGDQEICGVDELTLTTTVTGPVETYQWFKDDVLLTEETNSSLIVVESGTYRVEVDGINCDTTADDEVVIVIEAICAPICSIVDFEENFGTGTGLECNLVDANTTYDCWDGTGQMDGGEYVISNTADGLNNGWHLGMEDHTEGDVNGRMLFINADDDQTGEFYRRTISLNSNTDYQFSAWITTVYDIDTNICPGTGIPSNVNFRIEDPLGALIQETNTGDIPNESEPNWQEFFIAFNTGVNTDIQLVLINNITGACGNDLAIDDITLTLENTQPQIITPEDMSLCDENGNETATFDLTLVIDSVLNGQNPSDFEISFHIDDIDANNGENDIANPANYINTANPETIFVRVETADEPSCFSVVDFDLIVDPVIPLNVVIPPQFDLCSTDNFPTLDGTPQNPAVDLTQVTYEWRQGTTIVSTNAIFTPDSAGTYTVTVNLAPCSQEIDATVINVTELPTLDLGDDEILCDGGTIEIVPFISGDNKNVSYLWSTGETSPTITVATSGTYDLTITVGSCTVSDTINITISDPIVVELTEGFKTCPNEPQVITATVSDPDASIQWFLNGDILTGETNATLNFTIATGVMGLQTYSVVATNGDCSGEGSTDITLYDVGNCVISQGISPGGSAGLNDELDLEFLSDRTGGITNFQIYNRLGTLVFEQPNYIKEWMGQDNDGNELPTGTYFYVIDFLSEDPVYGPQATGWVYLNRDSN